jgi:uroporphyrinogen decarboxylase
MPLLGDDSLLNGYDRIMAALRRKEEPDYVPIWELIINEPVINKLYGRVSYLDFVDKIDLDGVTAPEDLRIAKFQDKPKIAVVDDFGIKWAFSGVVFQPSEGPIKHPEDIDSLELPDPDDQRKYYSLKAIVQKFKGRKAIVFLSHDGFEHSWYLSGGIMNYLRLYVLNPKAAKRLVERVWSYKERVMKNAVELGADILLTGDDYASRDRVMMSPKHFKEFIAPYLQKAVEIAKKNNMPFIKHTDGNLWEVMDTIIGTGIDGLHPLEPVADMDIGKVKQRYGDRIAVIGNIDCSYVLPRGTVNEVSDAVKETIAKGSPGGGHILSSSNSIHLGVNPENYRTMVKVARKYGKYPINKELIKEYRNRDYISRILGTLNRRGYVA